MQIKSALPFFLAIFLLVSCKTPQQVSYFQDLTPGAAEEILNSSVIRVKPEDQISIIVNSKDPLLADLFNLPIVAHRVGYAAISSAASSQQISGYTVNKQGEIDFPVLGHIQVAGLSREEIASKIKNELITNSLVKDPVVTVEFMNHCIAVLGEVKNPGRYGIDRDKITLLDALSMAGDLTIYGKRENVRVFREENGRQVPYQVNLCSGYDLLASPVYYLQQNDVIYVEPNNVRARQSTVNGNNVRSSSFWLSLASLLTTVVVLIVK